MNKKSGFTLMELLIVMLIISILAAVIITSLSSSRDKARYARVVSDFNSITQAAYLVQDDLGGEWPADTAFSAVPTGFVPRHIHEWPTPPCSGYYYDWEHWNGGDDIRITLRNAAGTEIFQKCIYQNGYVCADISETTNQAVVCS